MSITREEYQALLQEKRAKTEQISTLRQDLIAAQAELTDLIAHLEAEAAALTNDIANLDPDILDLETERQKQDLENELADLEKDLARLKGIEPAGRYPPVWRFRLRGNRKTSDYGLALHQKN